MFAFCAPTAAPFVVSTFASIVLRDCIGSLPQGGDLQEHLRAAEAWLERAHDRSPDDGVSYGYSLRGGWMPSYRETSGYIATTFFTLAKLRRETRFRDRAIRICRWLVSVQNADGSFSNPRYGDRGIVFDTGQDLFGLVRAHEETGEQAFRDAAQRAGEWLVRVAGPSGVWTHNEHLDTPHVYNTRTAWALLQLNQIAPTPAFERIARANLDWALAEQQPSGFFDCCSFHPGVAPYTHTIAYVTRGLLESAAILGETSYESAAQRCADAALLHIGQDGFIPGEIEIDGRASARYCCLTGNCQLSIIWLKLYRRTGDEKYNRAAARAIDYVARHQDIRTSNLDLRGAIKGSHPVWGKYAPLSLPNWASKFFVDALLLRLEGGEDATGPTP